MLLVIPVKISDNNRNNITTTDSAGAGSLAQRGSSQPALSTALSASSMHVCFTKQHRDEYPSSATRSARITGRSMRSSAPSARTRSSARSLSRSFVPCHCGMYVSHVCLSLWYVMSHANPPPYLLRECHGRKTRVQRKDPKAPASARKCPKAPASTSKMPEPTPNTLGCLPLNPLRLFLQPVPELC